MAGILEELLKRAQGRDPEKEKKIAEEASASQKKYETSVGVPAPEEAGVESDAFTPYGILDPENVLGGGAGALGKGAYAVGKGIAKRTGTAVAKGTIEKIHEKGPPLVRHDTTPMKKTEMTEGVKGRPGWKKIGKDAWLIPGDKK